MCIRDRASHFARIDRIDRVVVGNKDFPIVGKQLLRWIKDIRPEIEVVIAYLVLNTDSRNGREVGVGQPRTFAFERLEIFRRKFGKIFQKDDVGKTRRLGFFDPILDRSFAAAQDGVRTDHARTSLGNLREGLEDFLCPIERFIDCLLYTSRCV